MCVLPGLFWKFIKTVRDASAGIDMLGVHVIVIIDTKTGIS